MNRIRPIAWVILAITIAFLCWQFAQRKVASKSGQAEDLPTASAPQSEPPSLHAARSSTGAQTNPADQWVAPDATSAAPRAALAVPVPSVPVPETAESSTLPAQTVLQNMRTTIRQY